MHAHEHAAASLPAALGHAALHALGIVLFVFLMMTLVDYLNTWSRGRLTAFMRGGRWRQYVSAALLGLLPGCLGSFMAVTLYIRGMLGLGGLLATMVATTGDAVFFMLAEFPAPALWLSLGLALGAIPVGALADWLLPRLGITPKAACCVEHHHPVEPVGCRSWPEGGVRSVWRRPHAARLGLLGLVALVAAGVASGLLGAESWGWQRLVELGLVALGAFIVTSVPDEYLVEHLVRHMIRRHLPRVAAWTVGTLLLLAAAEHLVDLDRLLGEQVGWVLLAAGLIGLLPDSSPQLLFVFLYAQGAVPFSVLLTNAIVQDGHGMLPLLSTGLRDPLVLKGLKLVLGLGLGYGLWACGL